MADVFFKCHACGNNLLVEETGVGQAYDCLHCGQSLIIPVPAGEVACAGCRQTLKIPDGMEGQSVRCPNCRQPVRVPGARQQVKLKASPVANVTAGSECPSCHAPVPADAVICIQCGMNLKTGQKVATATASTSRASAGAAKKSEGKSAWYWVKVGFALLFLVFAVRKLWRNVFPPAPQYSQRAPVVASPPDSAPQPPPATPAPPTPTAASPTLPPGPPGPMMPPGPMPVMPTVGAPPGFPAGATPPPAVPATELAAAPSETVSAAPEPPKPPPLLITPEDLQHLGPLEKLTVGGTTYENVRWTRVSPVEVFFFHRGGAASVPIVALMPALKQQYHFEPPERE